MAVKHTLGLFTMIIILTGMTDFKKGGVHLYQDFLKATGLYAGFLFTTKSEGRIAVCALAGLGLAYILELYKNTGEEDDEDEEESRCRMCVSESLHKGLVAICCAALIVGVAVNIKKQKQDKGKGFDWATFILGSSQGCDSLK
jgi:hypothetical protein